MKKILSMLLAFALSLICFVGCGSDDPFLQGGSSGGSSGGTVRTYTITYQLTTDVGEMEGEETQEVTYGQSFTLNKLIREDYIGYWTYNGEKFEEGIWNLETDITLVAKWEKKTTPTPPENDDENWTNIY